MFRIANFIFLWLLLSGFSPGQQIILNNPQLRPDNASAGLPAIDDNFTTSGYPLAGGNCAEWGHRVPCGNHYSVTRSGAIATCVMTDGMVSLPFAANTMRNCNGNGALIEEARTNSALWARDMTNAAWVKVGMGNALNATGADGVANSATTLTATGTAGSCAASCTILQTLTLGSAADTYSVYLMRVTGSGAVNITINNLVGTTACTLVTTSFTRCTVTATLANPMIGIQLATLNDVVVADFNQLEAGSFASSAIPTTTVAVTRAADNITAIGLLDIVFRSVSQFSITKFVVPSSTTNPRAFDVNGSFTMITGIPASQATLTANGAITSASVNGASGTITKMGGSLDANGKSLFLNNDVGTTSGIAGTFTSGTTMIGNNSSLNRALNSSIGRLVVDKYRPSDATLKAMTIP